MDETAEKKALGALGYAEADVERARDTVARMAEKAVRAGAAVDDAARAMSDAVVTLADAEAALSAARSAAVEFATPETSAHAGAASASSSN